MQNLPDQATLPMGNRSGGLLIPEPRYRAAIDNLEDASFGLYCGVGSLIENAPHALVALGRPVTGVAPRGTDASSFFLFLGPLQ